MESSSSFREEEDPDYSTVNQENRRENINLSLQQQDARELATQKIEKIIRQQFAFEMHLKEREIELIDQRISQAKIMLDRLRACVLAKYYGTCEVDRSSKAATRLKSKDGQISNRGTSAAEAVNLERKTRLGSHQVLSLRNKITKEGNSNIASGIDKSCAASISCTERLSQSTNPEIDPTVLLKTSPTAVSASNDADTSVAHSSQDKIVSQDRLVQLKTQFSELETLPSQSDSRFYIKKQVIVGNTSKYIPMEKREANDKSTHKWMVYVRGPPNEPHLDKFIKKVWFFLHPSYRPNDIVEVSKQPFHLTRRGWGEFPIRVQLHFLDQRNKRVDIIHELKLDRTYTGLQTLGAETVVDLELDRRTFPEYGTTVVSELKTEVTVGNLGGECCQTQVNVEALKDNENSVSKLKRKSDSEGANEMTVVDSATGKHPSLKRVKMEPQSVVSALSSAVTTPFSSRASSRCTSPEPELKEVLCRKYSDELEKSLQLSVKLHPLIDPARNINVYPYCASSVEEFLNWNVGKQRACELQRSLAMKRHILQVLPSCGLTTKEVMIWCRRYGYTPQDELPVNQGNSFCVVCGRPVNTIQENDNGESVSAKQDTFLHEDCLVEEQSLKSLSNCNEFLLAVEAKEQGLPDLPSSNDFEDEIEVDVVGVENVDRSKPRQSSGTDWIPMTEGQKWVRSVAGEIGVTFQAVNTKGVRSNIVEEMILGGCKKLVDEVIRTGSACAADQLSPFQSKLLVPLHLHKALASLPHCDFLSNSSLGILVEKTQQL